MTSSSASHSELSSELTHEQEFGTIWILVRRLQTVRHTSREEPKVTRVLDDAIVSKYY